MGNGSMGAFTTTTTCPLIIQPSSFLIADAASPSLGMCTTAEPWDRPVAASVVMVAVSTVPWVENIAFRESLVICCPKFDIDIFIKVKGNNRDVWCFK